MLKGRLAAGLGALFTFLALAAGSVAAAPAVAVRVDNQPVQFDVPPVIRSARTFLPLRKVSEALGAAVHWEAAEQKVLVQLDDLRAELWIGQSEASVNGRPTALDVAPFIVDGRTMVPLRFLAETFRFIVDWDEISRTVRLTSPDGVPPTLLALSASTPTTRVGETVTVTVHVQRARSLYTAAVTLDVPAGLSGQELMPGDVGMDLTAVSRVDDRAGQVEYAASRVGPVRGFSGDGVLFTARFAAQAPGRLYLAPTPDSLLVDSGLEPMDTVLSGITIEVTP